MLLLRRDALVTSNRTSRSDGNTFLLRVESPPFFGRFSLHVFAAAMKQNIADTSQPPAWEK